MSTFHRSQDFDFALADEVAVAAGEPTESGSGVDRKAADVILAVVGLEKRELADLMGYRKGYVTNVMNGLTKASPAFKEAFGNAIAELVLGPSGPPLQTLPAAPLKELIKKRAEQAPCESQFYSDLGINPQGWNKRQVVTEVVVDKICCALGVHPSAIYDEIHEEAS